MNTLYFFHFGFLHKIYKKFINADQNGEWHGMKYYFSRKNEKSSFSMRRTLTSNLNSSHEMLKLRNADFRFFFSVIVLIV